MLPYEAKLKSIAMNIIKCKMCGGDLSIQPGMTVAECMYCGSMQTIPNISDEKKATLYDRAGYYRRNNDYDKAMSIYEQLIAEDSTDAEAHWSAVLCRYGMANKWKLKKQYDKAITYYELLESSGYSKAKEQKEEAIIKRDYKSRVK